MTKHYYKHLGYYNNVLDIITLGGETADDIVEDMAKDFGHFYPSWVHEVDNDVCIEDEPASSHLILTEDKEYLITDDTRDSVVFDEWKNSLGANHIGPDDSSGFFIDIYQLYAIEEDGFRFIREDL